MSRNRILSTHTGSLPRSEELLVHVLAKDAGKPVDEAKMDAAIRSEVKDIIGRQITAGVDIINDGEVSRPSFTTYIRDRLTGFGGEGSRQELRDLRFGLSEFPDFLEMYTSKRADAARIKWPACDGPIAYGSLDGVKADIANLAQTPDRPDGGGLFLSAVSPGTVVIQFANNHYPSEQAYLEAIAAAMRTEYEAIHAANIVLQLDCPDFALPVIGKPIAEHRKILQARVEALNNAVANIPAEAMRVHVCWGAAELPHNHDVPLADIIDILLTAKPAGLMVTAANGRHEHEWKVFEDVKLPDGKYLVPGVIDSTTNIIEHPEAVAQRLVRYAKVVGRENVMAGVDCGFSTTASNPTVAPSVVWHKLKSMSEGAKLASNELWKKR